MKAGGRGSGLTCASRRIESGVTPSTQPTRSRQVSLCRLARAPTPLLLSLQQAAVKFSSFGSLYDSIACHFNNLQLIFLRIAIIQLWPQTRRFQALEELQPQAVYMVAMAALQRAEDINKHVCLASVTVIHHHSATHSLCNTVQRGQAKDTAKGVKRTCRGVVRWHL